jgi:catechol 2,3-dioxygenase-like lactoylglutathione lyase family enzyme
MPRQGKAIRWNPQSAKAISQTSPAAAVSTLRHDLRFEPCDLRLNHLSCDLHDRDRRLEGLALEIRGQILHNGDVQIDANITFLQVSDIERSRTFYAEGLGLTLVLDQGGCQIYRLTDTSYLGICERAEPVSSNVIVTIVSEDVAGWHERFTSAGADADGPPRDNSEYRIHHFFANDPDGHLIEIQRFWDADWAESPT